MSGEKIRRRFTSAPCASCGTEPTGLHVWQLVEDGEVLGGLCHPCAIVVEQDGARNRVAAV